MTFERFYTLPLRLRSFFRRKQERITQRIDNLPI